MSQDQEADPEARVDQTTPTPGLDTGPGNELSVCDKLNMIDDNIDDDEAQRIFRTFSDPGRKKSLKSLEIPLDNLLSGLIFLSGGRDKRGCPLVTLTQPKNLQVDWLIEIGVNEIIDMLAYFTSVPNEESRALGFVVLLDAEIIHDFFMKTLVKALNIIQNEDEPFTEVFFVSSTRDVATMDWTMECEENIDLPFRQISNRLELLEFIDKDQLTLEFDGDFAYNHQEWVRFRMQVEPFLCDCISISKHLARAIEPFTDSEVPETIEDVKQSIHKHKMVRRKTLDDLHIDELTSEGSRINNQMVEGLARKASINPDVQHTVETIQKMLSQIELVKGRMVSLWSTKNDKLQASLEQRIFEKEASQLIEWFEEYAEEFFQTHTELGESLDVAETLMAELNQFECSTQQIMGRVDEIVQNGSELEQNPHTDQQTVTGLMGKIQTFMTGFYDKLGQRKKTLRDAVRLHKLIEKALTWSIEGAVVLSETTGLDPIQAKELVQQFLATHPRPTSDNLKELLELSEKTDSHWIRDTSVFTCNRVTDIGERVDYTCQLIEDMVVERRKSQEFLLDKSTGSSGSSPEMGVSSNHLVHQESTTSGGSLHYDTGADKALLLLQSVGTAVETAAERLDAGDFPSLPSSPTKSVEAVDAGAGDPQISLLDMLEELEKNEYPTLKRQHLSKKDISGPTETSGPTFVMGDEAVEEPPVAEVVTPEVLKKRVELLPCPGESDLNAQTKNAKHRRKLMEELIQTEMTYIRDLEWVVKEYMPAMDNLDELPRSLVGKRNLIFCNIQQLLEFNRQMILPLLESCRKCPIKLGEIFLMFEEELLNYCQYFKNLPLQTKLMNEGGHTFFAMTSKRLNDSFVLGSYLIKPFQRMARYQLFLKDLIKHSVKSDLAGKLKQYYDKLKEAQKMTDFILRHGNDLLAVECLKGFDERIDDQGKILRQGDLVLVEMTKHKRRVFLFESTIILAKRKKRKHSKDIASSDEVFEYKDHYTTKDFVLRETVEGHPTRFTLSGKKVSLCFQADSVDLKNTWVQDIWDLFFSHMLQLKDKNLERHGSRELTSLMAAGPGRSATIGRSFGHSIRHTMSMRYRTSLDFPRSRRSRPGSLVSITSNASEVSSSSLYSEDTLSQVSSSTSMAPSSSSTSMAPGSPSTFMDLSSHSASQVGLHRTSSGSMLGDLDDTLKRTSSGSGLLMRRPSPSNGLSMKRVSSGSNVSFRKSPIPDDRRFHLAVETRRTPEATSPIPPTSSSSGGSQDSDPEMPLFESPL